ncbi:MAG: substrate-binding domain-containing protein [Dermatophilaceae bacterium]
MPGVSSVDVDNVGGASLATEHLIGLGRRRIGCIAGPLDACSGSDRTEGFQAAMRAALLDDSLLVEGDWTSLSGAEGMRRLLTQEPRIDGVVASSDVMALGALHALREAGRRVPQDVAVVGFDDIDLARHASPPLTTIRQPAAYQAQRMIDVLLARLEGGVEDSAVELPVDLVVRESA